MIVKAACTPSIRDALAQYYGVFILAHLLQRWPSIKVPLGEWVPIVLCLHGRPRAVSCLLFSLYLRLYTGLLRGVTAYITRHTLTK